MSQEKEITCIICPIGCHIVVSTDGKTCMIKSGDKCKRGQEYARSEALDPRRMLTSSVLVKGGEWPLVSVKSSEPLPKDKLYEVLDAIKKQRITAPVRRGQKIIENVGKLGIDIIATKTVEKKR